MLAGYFILVILAILLSVVILTALIIGNYSDRSSNIFLKSATVLSVLLSLWYVVYYISPITG